MVGESQLEGESLCSEVRQYSYHVYEKARVLLCQQGVVYRQNEIWRDRFTKQNVGGAPKCLQSERLYKNRVVVKYAVDETMMALNS